MAGKTMLLFQVVICTGLVLPSSFGLSLEPLDQVQNSEKSILSIQTASVPKDEVVKKLWPDGIVYYSVSDLDERKISHAMQVWEKFTCITFEKKPNSNSKQHVKFIKSSKCQADFGWDGNVRTVYLTEKCTNKTRTLIHEIGHVIGLGHENNRPDRDDYVTIITKNIKSDFKNAFSKRDDWEVWNKNFSYDYYSVMHYSWRAFQGTRGWTMKPVKGKTVIRKYVGKLEKPSFGDIRRVNKMYECRRRTNGCMLKEEHCSKKQATFVDKNCQCLFPGKYIKDEPIRGCKQHDCKNGGTFIPATCSCACPMFYSGSFCEECKDKNHHICNRRMTGLTCKFDFQMCPRLCGKCW